MRTRALYGLSMAMAMSFTLVTNTFAAPVDTEPAYEANSVVSHEHEEVCPKGMITHQLIDAHHGDSAKNCPRSDDALNEGKQTAKGIILTIAIDNQVNCSLAAPARLQSIRADNRLLRSCADDYGATVVATGKVKHSDQWVAARWTKVDRTWQERRASSKGSAPPLIIW